MKFNQDPHAVWLKPIATQDNSNTERDYYYDDATGADQNSDTSKNQSSRSTNVKSAHVRHIFLYYSSTDETTITSELMIDLPSFISAIGGNLGLFLGFSFMGVIFTFYNMLKSHIHWTGGGSDKKRAKCLA